MVLSITVSQIRIIEFSLNMKATVYNGAVVSVYEHKATLVAVYEHVHNGKRSCTRTALHGEYSTDPIHRNGYVLEA